MNTNEIGFINQILENSPVYAAKFSWYVEERHTPESYTGFSDGGVKSFLKFENGMEIKFKFSSQNLLMELQFFDFKKKPTIGSTGILTDLVTTGSTEILTDSVSTEILHFNHFSNFKKIKEILPKNFSTRLEIFFLNTKNFKNIEYNYICKVFEMAHSYSYLLGIVAIVFFIELFY